MIIEQPIKTGIARGIASGIYNDTGGAAPPAGATLAFHALTPDATTYEMLGVKTGTGDLTTTHTADVYGLDAGDTSTSPITAGVYRKFGANEAVWSGGRVVSNFLRNSEDLTDATWVAVNSSVATGVADPDGGTDAFTITATAGNGRLHDSLPAYSSNGYASIFSAYIRRRTGTGPVRLFCGSSNLTYIEITITAEWQRVSAYVSSQGAMGRAGFSIGTSGDEIDVYHPQCEAVGVASFTNVGIVNGGFATDSDWTKGAGWTIGGNVASCDGTQGSNSNLSQSFVQKPRWLYIPSFEVTAYTAGNIGLRLAGYQCIPDKTSTGVYTDLVTGNSNDGSVNLDIHADSNFVGSVDNVSLYEAIYERDLTPSEYLATSGSAVTKTFANQNGNTVLNNVVTEAVGTPLAEVPYLQYYPAATNLLTYSNNITENSAAGKWLSANLANTVITQDQIGLTGEPNSATYCEESKSTGARGVYQTPTVTASKPITLKVWVKKENDETTFPAFSIFQNDVNTYRYDVMLNKQTGAAAEADTCTISGSYEVINEGDWWILLVSVDSDVYTQARFNFSFAFGSVLGVFNAGAMGNATVGNIEAHDNKTIAQVRGLGPIFTTTAAVAADKTVYSFDIANHANTDKGAIYFDHEYNLAAVTVASLYLGSSDRVNVQDVAGNAKLYTAGGDPIISTVLPEVANQLGLVWSSGESKGVANANGTYGTEVAAGIVNNNRASIPINAVGGADAQKWRDLRFYTIADFDQGKTKIDDLMP